MAQPFLPREQDSAGRSPAPEMESSVDLLRRVRSGDQAALERLCARHLPGLRRWASHRLPPWARDLLDTDDVVQETLLHTLHNVSGFEPRRDGALQAYLRNAVLNRIRNEMRRARRQPPSDTLPEDGQAGEPSPLEEAIGREALERYERALQTLREEDREAVIGRVELGLDYDELSRALSKPSPDAARVAVGRALVRLAQEMKRGRST